MAPTVDSTPPPASSIVAAPATPPAATSAGDTRLDLPPVTGPGAGDGDQGARNGAGPQAAWSATVTADRAYFDAVREASGPDADGIDFPAYCPERRFRLTGSEVRIGRRSASRGISPEIDLTGPPSDPGVSRLHAVLIAGKDGTWSVLDPGSANGTLVNGSELAPNEAVKLDEGDRVNLGAWTLLIVSRDN